MASGMTPTKKLVVRTSLVTGSTLALIIGAQALVTVDLQKKVVNSPPVAQAVELVATDQPTQQITPTPTIINALPNIVILRHASQAAAPVLKNTSQQAANPAPVRRHSASASIQPPAPVVVQVQPQTIIQTSGGGGGSSPSAPTTHSSH